MALTSAQQITQLYVGYFNRAPDPEGLNYWIGRLNSGEMNVQQIAESFSEQPETLATYPFLRYPNLLEGDTKAFITEIYQNAFNRAPDAEGLDYWTAQLTSGAVPVGDFIASVLSGATNSAAGQDLTTLDNKTTVGLNYADAVAQANVQWTPESAHAVLDGVNDTQASVAAADAEIAAFVAGSQQDGETVQLTVGNDVLTANIFDAPLVNTQGNVDVPTLNPADVLTGVGDNPTLNAVLNGQLALSPTLKGIETLNLETVATTTLNAVKATGVETLAHEAGAGVFNLTVRNLGSNATIAVNNAVGTDPNAAPLGGASTNIRFANSVVSGAEDVASLVLTNNGSAELVSGVINLRGETTGGFETINVTANGVNRIANIGSDSSVGVVANISNQNTVRTLNVDGEGSLRVDNVLQRVTKVDASENEGGVRFNIDTTVAATVLGGSGNDNINFDAGLTNADKFDGGEGRDTIQVSALNGLGAGNQISNVEILRVNDSAAGNVDLDNLKSIDAIVHNTDGAINYENFSAAGASDNGITVLDVGTVTVEVKGADTGLADTLKVTYGSASESLAAGFVGVNGTAGGLTADNVEQVSLNVVADRDGNVTKGTGALDFDSLANLTITGGVTGQWLVVNGNAPVGVAAPNAGVLASQDLTRIDASAFVGDIAVTGSVTGQVIVGGNGGDIIGTGGRQGADARGDTLTGGAGEDTFIFADTDIVNANVYSKAGAFTASDLRQFTSITDLTLGGGSTSVDQLNFTAIDAGFDTNVDVLNAGGVVSLSGALTLAAGLDAAFAASTAAGNAVGLFSYGGQTFLAGSIAGNDWTAGTDIVVRVTGVTGTLDGSDFVV